MWNLFCFLASLQVLRAVSIHEHQLRSLHQNVLKEIYILIHLQNIKCLYGVLLNLQHNFHTETNFSTLVLQAIEVFWFSCHLIFYYLFYLQPVPFHISRGSGFQLISNKSTSLNSLSARATCLCSLQLLNQASCGKCSPSLDFVSPEGFHIAIHIRACNHISERIFQNT